MAMAYEEGADDIEVWRPTREEWGAYVRDGLDRLGLTYDELAKQARRRDFRSPEARDFWVVIGGRGAVNAAKSVRDSAALEGRAVPEGYQRPEAVQRYLDGRNRRVDPVVTVDPAVRFGFPAIRGISTDAIAGVVWAGESLATVADEYDVTREEVLVACWFEGTHGERKWRKRWGAWAEQVHGEFSNSRYDVPDPPTGEDPEGDDGPDGIRLVLSYDDVDPLI